jgi:hypothetical protein
MKELDKNPNLTPTFSVRVYLPLEISDARIDTVVVFSVIAFAWPTSARIVMAHLK